MCSFVSRTSSVLVVGRFEFSTGTRHTQHVHESSKKIVFVDRSVSFDWKSVQFDSRVWLEKARIQPLVCDVKQCLVYLLSSFVGFTIRIVSRIKKERTFTRHGLLLDNARSGRGFLRLVSFAFFILLARKLGHLALSFVICQSKGDD